MTELAYQRVNARFGVEVPVVVEDFRTGFCYDGVVCNYCTDGVYMESAYALRPGRLLRLQFNGAVDIFAARTYLAEVRWRCCCPPNKTSYTYGAGLKYC